MPQLSLENARRLLCRLQDHIRDTLLSARPRQGSRFARIAAVTTADTIYHIDRISEEAIVEWFESEWPRSAPIEVVMEGIEESEPLVFPRGTALTSTVWKVILDPVDGTRGLMYDKRSAWALAGLAIQRGMRTTLKDIVVAAMTELPISKQWRADQYSAVRGGGLKATATDVRTGVVTRIRPSPSGATDFTHGFASFAKFFPQGMTALSQLEEKFWHALHGEAGNAGSPLVFNDQYISTGGQLHELICGHDRMIVDLRPIIYRTLGLDSALVCHPYDICTALLLEEAGGVIDDGQGKALCSPLDTTSPVSWVGYANPHLARAARPVLKKLLQPFVPPVQALKKPRK